MVTIEQMLIENWPEVEEEILKVIPKEGIPNLYDAVWYHFNTGGKRLRPVLAIATCKAFDGDVKKVIPFAAACEMFHNWTLIHDDLEDGDKMRRNKPAVWVKYGEPHGINIGDYMEQKTYDLVLKCREIGVDHETFFWLLKEMVETACKTAEGQTFDINLRKNDNPSENEYMKMAVQKTAYYLTIPIIGGAIIGGASKEIVNKIKDFGLKIGPAFQITDDLLDLTEGKGRKEIGCDIKEGKRTLMIVHCASKCNLEEKKGLFEILNKKRGNTTKKDILWIKNLFEKHDSIEYARKKAKILVEKSKEIISDTPLEIRKILNDFADYMIERKH